jgi:non-homologous end joining protein Ku
MSGGEARKPERSGNVVDLLGQLQASVDRAKADRAAARAVPCDRPGAHPAHTYVATAKSGIDFHCPGVPA